MTEKIVFVPQADPLKGPLQPEIREVDLTLQTMQSLVGGYLQCLALDYTDGTTIHLWVNEYGRNTGLFPNRIVQRPIDGAEFPIVGNFFIAATASDGEDVGLTDAQAEEWLTRMQEAAAGRVAAPGMGEA